MGRQWYKCSLKPLDYYFFGGSRSAAFDSVSQNSYYVISQNLPPQSTLLGMLRFLLLKQNQLLYENGETDSEKRTKGENLVGCDGFHLDKENSYGMIQEISPLFLCDTENQYLIKTPYNHNLSKENKYTPFKMGHLDNCLTENDVSLLPIDYEAKKGITESYMYLDKTIVSEDSIFLWKEKIHIARKRDKDGFFKKKYCCLNKAYTFVFYVCLEEKENIDSLPASDIVYLGQEKSIFHFRSEICENDFWENVIEKMQIEDADSELYDCYYLVSDGYFPEKDIEKKNVYFQIIRKQDYKFMNRYGNIDDFDALYKSKQYTFYKQGSVFYVKKGYQIQSSEKLKKIGFNCLIKIGGQSNE